MSDTIASLSTNPLLRNFAQDYAQRGVKPIANFFAPTVEVPTLIGQYKEYNAKHRYKRPNTRRNALEGRATRIGFSVEDETYRLEPHAIDFPVSDYEKLSSDELMNTLQYGSQLTADAANLDHELEVIEKVLSAVGAGTDENILASGFKVIDWLDDLIMDRVKAAKNGAPIRIGMGLKAWLRLRRHDSVLSVLGGGRTQKKLVSLEEFKKLLAFDVEIQVSNIVVDSAAEGVAESVDFALDNQLIIFPCNGTPNTMDASWLKTFRLAGKWMVTGSYEGEDGRDHFLKLDWTHQLKETNVGAAVRYNVDLS